MPDLPSVLRTLAAGLVFLVSMSMSGAVVRADPLPAPAVASETSPPTAAQRRQARKDLADGRKLLKKERFEEALAKLQVAYAIDPQATTLLGIAEAQRQSDRLPEAYRSYEKLVGDPGADIKPDERAAAERAFADLGAHTGTVKLTPSEPDATCSLNGRAIGAAEIAQPIRLVEGRYTVTATKPGFEAASTDVVIEGGRASVAALALRPEIGKALVAGPTTTAGPAGATSPPPLSAAPAAAPISPPPPLPVAPPTAASPPSTLPAPAAPSPPTSAPETPPPPAAPASEVAPAPSVELAPILPSAPGDASPSTSPAVVDWGTPRELAPPPPEDDHDSATRVGLVIGILSLPRPIEGELTVKLGGSLALGLQGSFLPELSAPGGDAKLDLKAVAGIARWFPFRGTFFLGAGVGYQTLRASLGKSVDNSELTTTADMSGFFVAPQLGWLWIWPSGFAVGFDIGVQIPLPKDPVVTSTYGGQPVPNEPTSSIPQDVVDQARSAEDTVRSVARFIVKYPFPTLDLLRIGFFF